MEKDRGRSRRKRLSAFAVAVVGVGIAVVGAGVGWAAHGLLRTDPTLLASETPKHGAPAKSAPASVAPPAPRPPATLREDGVVLEDTPLVHQFLARSVRCGSVAGEDFYASVLDLLKLRTRGLASPPFHYEVRDAQRDGYDYVVVREQILRRDHSPFPGAPGYVVHTYHYDAPMDRFELASSVPENPDFNRAMLREMGNPLGFLALNWEAVCDGALYLHRAKATPAMPGANGASAAAGAHAHPVNSGLGQWAGAAE